MFWRRWTTYSLKEHQDSLRVVDNERRRETAVAAALTIFAFWREIQRRLFDLNHAHERAEEEKHTYVTDEKFGDFVQRYEEKQTAVAKALTLAEGKGLGMLRFWLIVVAVATLALMLLAIVVSVVIAGVTITVIYLTN